LNRAMSEESAAANMADILKFIRDKKDVMRVALGEGVSAPKQPTAPPVPKTAVPDAVTPIYASNGKVRIMSTDGGKTWKPVGAK